MIALAPYPVGLCDGLQADRFHHSRKFAVRETHLLLEDGEPGVVYDTPGSNLQCDEGRIVAFILSPLLELLVLGLLSFCCSIEGCLETDGELC